MHQNGKVMTWLFKVDIQKEFKMVTGTQTQTA
jgi:hypothetical protein